MTARLPAHFNASGTTPTEEGLSKTRLTVRIENSYLDGTSTHVETITVAASTNGDLDAWADEELHPLTGTGRPSSDPAMYSVEIVAADDYPSLVGRIFEWG